MYEGGRLGDRVGGIENGSHRSPAALGGAGGASAGGGGGGEGAHHAITARFFSQ